MFGKNIGTPIAWLIIGICFFLILIIYGEYIR